MERLCGNFGVLDDVVGELLAADSPASIPGLAHKRVSSKIGTEATRQLKIAQGLLAYLQARGMGMLHCSTRKRI